MKELHPAPEELFWYFISERHSIFLKRQRGEPKPWTTDPILRDYKFTNPFRENDRGTIWLRENFLIPHRNDDSGLIVHNIAWYRMFNWWGTGALLGWQTDWEAPRIKQILEAQLSLGNQVFTGAHIVYSPPGRGKVEAIVDVCDDLYKNRQYFVNVAETTNSLEKTYTALRQIYCVGGFLAYEMVTDLRHTRLLEHADDIDTWANMGPGCQRGLQRLGLPCRNQAEGVQSMRELLTRSISARDGEFRDLSIYPVLEMRDIEHSLCELDKYCRVKFGEGEPRSKFNGRG